MSVSYRVLTAENRGAIAVLRLWGTGAIELADAVFRPRRGAPLKGTPPGRLRLGRAGLGPGDEVVAVRLPGPSPVVEFQCHGGAAAVASVARALEAEGAVRTGRTPMAGDRIRAQALEDLAAAPTLRTAEILLDQYEGALSDAIGRLLDDTGPEVGRDASDLEVLIRRAEVGRRLRRGWKVVLAGRPNVGKSRLFNALAGFERSIVAPTPGVTRDVVSFRTAFGGWPVEVSDTAGERDAEDAVEGLGIDRARRERRDADLVLLVLDRSEPLQEADRRLIAENPDSLVVANKCDLPPAWEPGISPAGGAGACPVSAETGAGLEDLIGIIVARLVPEPPPPGAGVPFRAEHLRSLAAARARLVAGDLCGFASLLTELVGPDAPH